MNAKKILLLLLFPSFVFAQEDQRISLDLDGDKIADHVFVDSETGFVTYQLSTEKFKNVESKDFVDNGQIFLDKANSGFKINIHQMRAGNSFQFRYEKETHKMRLIGMSRYEFGPASNDGSGESSVNLLTNNYIGEWNYYDDRASKLMKIPVIKKKMVFRKSYFNEISDVYSQYVEKDVAYYRSEKNRLYKT